MDALPGTPQIQNIIPSSFFGTNTWAAPWLGTLGGVFILIVGMLYLDWRRRVALGAGEGYGDPAKLVNEPAEFTGGRSEEHTSELQSLMRISYAVFCLQKKTTKYIYR